MSYLIPDTSTKLINKKLSYINYKASLRYQASRKINIKLLNSSVTGRTFCDFLVYFQSEDATTLNFNIEQIRRSDKTQNLGENDR